MNTSTIATIAGAAVSLLVPYLKSLGEELVKKAGGEIGTKAGGAAWSKAKLLYDTISVTVAQSEGTCFMKARI